MVRIFPIIRRIIGGVASAFNWRAEVKPASQLTASVSGTPQRENVAGGGIISWQPTELRIEQNPAADLDVTAMGTPVTVEQKGASQLLTRATLPTVPVAGGGVAKQLTIALIRNAGAPSAAGYVVATRNDWTNVTNAQGDVSGSPHATMTSNTLAARAGGVRLDYGAQFDKTALTITKVELRYYTSQAGTALSNGNLRHMYQIGAAAAVTLATHTGNVNFLTTPESFDITAAIAGSWANVDALDALVEAQYALAPATITASLDAVHLYIEASVTQVLTP